MNIIISSLDEIRKTGVSNDLDSAKLFISTSIEDQDSLLSSINLINDSGIYYLTAISSKELNKKEYNGYFLTTDIYVPDGTYTFQIGDLELSELEIIGNNNLIDQHNPILINDRKINPVTTTIVAGDAHSQLLTFYIKKKYDGVSFIDGKTVFADYIPLNLKELQESGIEGIDENTTCLSDRVEIVSQDVMPPSGTSGEWIMLKWELSPFATALAGTVPFAISVIGTRDGDGKQIVDYIWQTLPSSFIVSKNLTLGARSSAEVPDLVQIVGLQERISNLETLLGNQADNNNDNDSEVIISGGNAPGESEI